jgi:ribosomal protein S27E
MNYRKYDCLQKSRISGHFQYTVSCYVYGNRILYPAGYQISINAELSGQISGTYPALIYLNSYDGLFFVAASAFSGSGSRRPTNADLDGAPKRYLDDDLILNSI